VSHLPISRDNTHVSAAFSDPTEIFGSPKDHLRRHLEAPGFLAWLSSIVRRRVPSSDVDDVVQAVLCDALASQLIPIDQREIGRWICGIAKNKVADFHRRAKREALVDNEEPSTSDRSGEVRVLLRAVVLDAAATARGEEALEWIVREHAGEDLSRIAEETQLPAPVVRQRVSRLRRALRDRWLGGGVLLLVLAASAGYENWKTHAHEHIAPDTAGSPLAASFLTEANGEWRVVEDPSTPELAQNAVVHINGALLTVVTAGIAHERLISIDAIHGNTIEAEISGNGEHRHVTATLTNGALTIQEGTRSLHLVRP
jgi:DNA-directed RNA polymerase specialized sigma24 family protein